MCLKRFFTWRGLPKTLNRVGLVFNEKYMKFKLLFCLIIFIGLSSFISSKAAQKNKIISITTEVSFSKSNQVARQMECYNENGIVVSFGASCQTGGKGCRGNACPEGSSENMF